MGILEQLLSEIKSEEIDQQIIELCDKIFEEERFKMDEDKEIFYMPKGPNIFLSLKVTPTKKNELAFLCLEREFKESYIISLWTGYIPKLENDETETLKKIKVWEVNDNRPAKVLTEYARIIKFLKGK